MQIQIIEQRILIDVLVDQALDRLVRLISFGLEHLQNLAQYSFRLDPSNYAERITGQTSDHSSNYSNIRFTVHHLN